MEDLGGSRTVRWLTQTWNERVRSCIGLLAACLVIEGCGLPQDPGGSQVSQLGTKDYPCVDYDKAQIAEHLKDMPEGFINTASFRVGSVDRLRNQLTGIPKIYLNHLYDMRKQNGFRIGERSLGRGVVGVTQRQAGRSMQPFLVDITNTPEAINFALQHELGHAVEGYVRQQSPSLNSGWNDLFRRESRNSNLRSYARSSATEYFAEAFANFYCSKDAQEFIRSNLPDTFKVMQSGLVKATWDQTDVAALVKDAWMQLVDEDGKTYMEVSVPAAIKKVALCKGTDEACKQNPQVFMDFASSTTKITGRQVFRSAKELVIENEMQVTMLIYGEDGKDPAIGRSVQFVQADQAGEP